MTPQEAVKEAKKFFEFPMVQLDFYDGEEEAFYTIGSMYGPTFGGGTIEEALEMMIRKQTSSEPYLENKGK